MRGWIEAVNMELEPPDHRLVVRYIVTHPKRVHYPALRHVLRCERPAALDGAERSFPGMNIVPIQHVTTGKQTPGSLDHLCISTWREWHPGSPEKECQILASSMRMRLSREMHLQSERKAWRRLPYQRPDGCMLYRKYARSSRYGPWKSRGSGG